jgi:hypothetical protein
MTNTLKHVGVLGMHWGHRKGSSKSSSPRVRLKKVKGSGPFGFKTSEDHAKDLVNSWKARQIKDIVIDLGKGAGKAAIEFTVGMAATWVTFKAMEFAVRQASGG